MPTFSFTTILFCPKRLILTLLSTLYSMYVNKINDICIKDSKVDNIYVWYENGQWGLDMNQLAKIFVEKALLGLLVLVF